MRIPPWQGSRRAADFSALQRLQVRDDISNLARIQLEYELLYHRALALSRLIFGGRKCHAGHRFDPKQIIMYLFDARNILGGDDACRALVFVQNHT
jgi:hypothetical protein